MTKLTLASLLLFLLTIFSGCGGSSSPSIVHAGSSNPTPPPFPMPAQAWNCTGDYRSLSGALCRESDGVTYYHLVHWTIAERPDGHGTFQATVESGNNIVALRSFTLPLPHPIAIVEMHPTASVNAFCAGVGAESNWKGYDVTSGTLQNLIGIKTAKFTSTIDLDVPVPQTVFPHPIPVSELDLYNFVDLCGGMTIHWNMTGSF